MSREKIGTAKVTFDFALMRDVNGALVWETVANLSNSNGAAQTIRHELSERDEIKGFGKDGKTKTYRRVGATGIELDFIGKNGKRDHKKSGLLQGSRVDTDKNRPMWDRVIGDTKTADGKDLTDGFLSIARSIGNACWDWAFFGLTQDGEEGPEKATADRRIGSAILSDYRKNLQEQFDNLTAAMGEEIAMKAFRAMTQYTGESTTIADIINDLDAIKAAAIKAEAEAKLQAKIKS